jgi:hypothetical protein
MSRNPKGIIQLGFKWLELHILASAGHAVHHKTQTEEAETEVEEHAGQAVAASEVNAGHRNEDF